MSVNETENFFDDEKDAEMFSASDVEEIERAQADMLEDDYELFGVENPKELMVRDSFKMFLDEISDISLLSADEERTLAEKAAAGDKDARNRLILANVRYVISVAKHYQGLGMELPDLVQHGILGLMDGIEHFECSKGYRISTYVSWWIKKEILSAIAEYGREFKVPEKVAVKFSRLNREKHRLEALGIEPDAERIAEAMGIERREAEKLMIRSAPCAYFESPVGESGDIVFGDTYEDKDCVSAESMIIEADTRKDLCRLMDTLSDDEYEIIMLRSGLRDDKAYSLKEVSKMCGISMDKVRKTEMKAVRKMRSAAYEELAG